MVVRHYRLIELRPKTMLYSCLGAVGLAGLCWLLYALNVARLYSMVFGITLVGAAAIFLVIAIASLNTPKSGLEINEKTIRKYRGNTSQTMEIGRIVRIELAQVRAYRGGRFDYLTLVDVDQQMMQIQLGFWEDPTQVINDILSSIPKQVPITEQMVKKLEDIGVGLHGHPIVN
jgi:hypothetical protein